MSAELFLLHVRSRAIKIIEIHNLEAVVWWRSINQVRLYQWRVFLKISQSMQCPVSFFQNFVSRCTLRISCYFCGTLEL